MRPVNPLSASPAAVTEGKVRAVRATEGPVATSRHRVVHGIDVRHYREFDAIYLLR